MKSSFLLLPLLLFGCDRSPDLPEGVLEGYFHQLKVATFPQSDVDTASVGTPRGLDSLDSFVVHGLHDVLRIDHGVTPDYKDMEVSDLDMWVTYYVVLDRRDSVVTLAEPGHSRMLGVRSCFCSPPFETFAVGDTSQAGAARISARRLGEHTWYLIVDSADLSFSSEVNLATPSESTLSWMERTAGAG